MNRYIDQKEGCGITNGLLQLEDKVSKVVSDDTDEFCHFLMETVRHDLCDCVALRVRDKNI